MREEELANVSTPFGRGEDLVWHARKGVGLGLPILAKFVELLGGTLTIGSEHGVGTDVEFELSSDMPPGK